MSSEPLFFDVHAHLHDGRIIKDAHGIQDRAEGAGIHYTATCATMEENFGATERLAETFGSVIPCYGIHPWFLDSLSPDWEPRLGEILSNSRSAVGETGLDFMIPGADRTRQEKVFLRHLSLARELNRPVNIHIRKAWDTFLRILKSMGPLPAGGLVHSYSGSADLIKMLTPFNLYFSFSGAVTRPNAKKVVIALNAVPLDRILFETDAPDLFPSLGGDFSKQALNEPMYVRDVVRIAAKRRKMNFNTLAGHGFANAMTLFSDVIPVRKGNDL